MKIDFKLYVITSAWLSLSGIAALGAESAPPNPCACGANTGETQGIRNFDGSCTFNNPQVSVAGQWLFISGLNTSGQASTDSAAGFCRSQGMTLFQINWESGCGGDSDFSTACGQPDQVAAILNADGRFSTTEITDPSVGSSFISQMTCTDSSAACLTPTRLGIPFSPVFPGEQPVNPNPVPTCPDGSSQVNGLCLTEH